MTARMASGIRAARGGDWVFAGIYIQLGRPRLTLLCIGMPQKLTLSSGPAAGSCMVGAMSVAASNETTTGCEAGKIRISVS
jgi:hypothetical protein